MINIIAVGDIMPGGVLNGTNKEYVSEDIKYILSRGDLRVGTLETAIGNEPTFYTEKMNRLGDVIYAMDDDLKRLVELNINVVSLANNHFFDLGPDGASHTIELLDKLGIKHCGGGCNIEEASRPAVETINGKTIAFLAFCDWRKETTGWCPFATDKEPGVNPMYDNYVVEQIKKYRTLYDYIVVIPHWGTEYILSPSRHVYRLSHLMIDAGADIIFGGHTHCVQPIVSFKHKTIVYSLGNFLFPDRLIIKPRSTYYSQTPLDLNALPHTDGYPYVEEITFKQWKPMGRIGMIVNVSLNDKFTNFNSFYTILTEDNKLTLLDKCPYERDIRTITIQLKSHAYLAFDIIRRIKAIATYKLRQVLNK